MSGDLNGTNKNLTKWGPKIGFLANSTLLVHLNKNEIPANQTINRDFLRHQILSLAWLPITTRPQKLSLQRYGLIHDFTNLIQHHPSMESWVAYCKPEFSATP